MKLKCTYSTPILAVFFFLNASCSGQLPGPEPEPIEPEAPLVATPVLPELPDIPDKKYVITLFGVIPNDNVDDTKAIQNAIDTVANNGGGRLIFPDGVYDLSIRGQGDTSPNFALSIRGKVALEAENSRRAILHLGDNQPNYSTIIYFPPTGNIGDVRIKGLVINQNSANNKPKTYDDFKYIENGRIVRWLPRQVLLSRNGKRIEIDDVHFTNLLNINTINMGVAPGSTGELLEKNSDVTITNCLFDKIGWSEYDFDHSTIYTQSNRFLIKDNVFKSVSGHGTLSARCAIELHGSDQTMINNEIDGFTIGANVTGTNILSERQLIENNKFINVARGIYFWSSENDSWRSKAMLSDVTVRKNTIKISPDAWLASSVPSRKHLAGITTNPANSSGIENLLIEENTIVSSGYLNATQAYKTKTIDCGIALNSEGLKNVYILNNFIGSNLGPHIGGKGSIDNLVIDNNKLEEPEIAAFSEWENRASINLAGAIMNFKITNNRIKDVEQPNNIEYGIIIKDQSKGVNEISGNSIVPQTVSLVK